MQKRFMIFSFIATILVGCSDEKSPTNLEPNSAVSEVKNEQTIAKPATINGDEYINISAVFKTKCASCHGNFGEKQALNKSKIIKDLSQDEIKFALNGYKDGSYGGAMRATMKGVANSLSANDIELIAKYIKEL